jgi:hypothetical protein
MIFFRRSAHQSRPAERKAMIDRAHDLPITKQAEALSISRGSVYYLPRPVPEADLAIMRRLDRLHLEFPFAGSRMLRDLMAAEGCTIGRRHVKTLMKQMGIDRGALSPSTHDEARAGTQDLSVSVARRGDHAAKPGVVPYASVSTETIACGPNKSISVKRLAKAMITAVAIVSLHSFSCAPRCAPERNFPREVIGSIPSALDLASAALLQRPQSHGELKQTCFTRRHIGFGPTGIDWITDSLTTTTMPKRKAGPSSKQYRSSHLRIDAEGPFLERRNKLFSIASARPCRTQLNGAVGPN